MRQRVARPLVSLAVSTAVVFVAIATCLVVIAIVGKAPGASASALWQGAFGGRQEIAGTLEKTVPLTLVSLGWIVAYTASRLNVGFEGQIVGKREYMASSVQAIGSTASTRLYPRKSPWKVAPPL